jgi:ribonuclease-3
VQNALTQLQQRIGYRFRQAELLTQALTHRSFGTPHNERLEFLGDSVLNMGVAVLLFNRFSRHDEGELSRVRANLVRQQSLHERARELHIASCLRLGDGEAKSGGYERPSILADAFEAVLGAMFLDGGFEPVSTLVDRMFTPLVAGLDSDVRAKDAKTQLQEWLQRRKLPLPRYEVTATHGAAHNQVFEITATLAEPPCQTVGSGASKRQAEQAAAAELLRLIEQKPPQKGAPGASVKGTS